MLKHAAALALLLLLAQPAVCQEIERELNDKPSPRIMIVMDVSGSMRPILSKVVSWAIENIVKTGTDDIEIGLITFDDISIRYSDVDENGKSREWFRLPAVPVLDRLTKRLEELQASGGTSPDFALREAYKSGAQTVVLITDGGFNSASNPSTVVKESIAELEKTNRSVPRLVIVGAQCAERPALKANLERLAKDTESQLVLTPE